MIIREVAEEGAKRTEVMGVQKLFFHVGSPCEVFFLPTLDVLNRASRLAAIRIATGSQRYFGLAPLQKCVGDFCCIIFGGFCRGFSWKIFLGTFSHKNEEKKSGEKIREKIRRPKNKNPRKIRSAKIRP